MYTFINYMSIKVMYQGVGMGARTWDGQNQFIAFLTKERKLQDHFHGIKNCSF